MGNQKSIVLILGNGFDLDLGLRTSYKDFWESKYCPKRYPAPLIRHLNSKWSDSIEAVKWYDMENELLNYYKETRKPNFQDVVTPKQQEFLLLWKQRNTSHINDYTEYVEEIKALRDNGLLALDQSWGLYMTCEFHEELILDTVTRDRKALGLIKQGLCSYLTELMKVEHKTNVSAISILRTVEEAHKKGEKVSIYTFNYTNLPYLDSELKNKSVYYVHGSCTDNNIIIGTKDEEMPSKDYTFLQKAFDKNFNPPPIVSELRNATDVIIFGHSLGDNDSQYLKDFFVQQASPSHHPKKITIFTYDDVSEEDIKFSLQKLTGTRLSALYAQNDVTIIKTASVLKNPTPLRNLIYTYLENINETKALMPSKDITNN